MRGSLYSIEKRLIMRETFENEASVRRNGGIPTTGVTFYNGKARLPINTASLSFPSIGNKVNGSARIKFKLLSNLNNGSNRVLFDFRNNNTNAGWFYITTTNTNRHDVGTGYVNGQTYANYAFTFQLDTVYDCVLTNIPISALAVYIGRIYSGNQYNPDIEVELFEIYSGTLSAEEVKNLYENKRYREVNTHDEQLGSELVVNGGFDTDNNWTKGSINTNISNGKINFVNDNQASFQSGIVAIGKLYKLVFTVTDYTSGGIRTNVGGGTTTTTRNAVGTYTEYITASGGTAFYLTPVGASTLSVDNISVKEVLINSTKLILDVNAFDGTVRNRLSGNPYKELITDTGFDNSSYWDKDLNITVADGVCHYSNPVNGANLSKFVLTVGKSYKLIFQIVSYTQGGVKVNTVTADNSPTWNAIGTYVFDFVAKDTTFYLRTVGATILDIDNISIKEVIPSVVNTAVSVVKEGDVNTPLLNGTTSKIDCGSYDGLIGDKTFVAWVNQKAYSNQYPRIVDNLKTVFDLDLTSTRVGFSSDNGTFAYSAVGSFLRGRPTMIAVTRTSTGITNLYINGVASGTANQSSGTPSAGTSNITIGSTAAGTRFVKGLTPSIRIYDGLLSSQEIASIYSSEKSKYGL